MHAEGHQERFPQLPPLYCPRNPSSLTWLARETCPLAPLPYHPSPHIPVGTPFAALSIPNLPISRIFWRLHALKWVQNGCTGSRDMPPQQASCTPHLSPLHPHSPRTPLKCTISPKIAYFKAFLELAWAHMGPRWLKIALNQLFELP